MTPVQLQIYVEPGGTEVYLNVRRKDGSFERLSAFVDTGAETSLLSIDLLYSLEHRLTRRSRVTVEQAGIARQSFTAVEAIVKFTLEDQYGAITNEFEAPFWFTETEAILIGFTGLLDRAVLHIDMLERSGWIEIKG